MKILISGALGHMGRAVAAQASADGIEIVAGVDALQAVSYTHLDVYKRQAPCGGKALERPALQL